MQIDEELLIAIQEIISKGNRAEIVPSKDGVKVYVAKRHEYKPGSSRDAANGSQDRPYRTN